MASTEATSNFIIPATAPVKIYSDDSVTYVTPNGIVYIYSKKKQTFQEYEGTIKNKDKMRNITLNADELNVVEEGESTKLTQDNVRELYPITSEKYENDEAGLYELFNSIKLYASRIVADSKTIK